MSDPTYLLPQFVAGVSLNGHIEEFLLSPNFYVEYTQEEDADPFNFTEIWLYVSKHIEEYLFDFGITESKGAIDVDTLKLVSLTVEISLAPAQLRELVDCEGCLEYHDHKLTARLSQGEDDEEDDDE